MDAFLLSFGVIFLAELGDKSQLMAMAFAARYKPLTVLVAVTIATLVVHAGSVLLGNVFALAQTNLKRLLGYSTISHIGFLLLGFVLFAYLKIPIIGIALAAVAIGTLYLNLKGAEANG